MKPHRYLHMTNTSCDRLCENETLRVPWPQHETFFTLRSHGETPHVRVIYFRVNSTASSLSRSKCMPWSESETSSWGFVYRLRYCTPDRGQPKYLAWKLVKFPCVQQHKIWLYFCSVCNQLPSVQFLMRAFLLLKLEAPSFPYSNIRVHWR
jgi:hypothetical protein